MPRKQAHRHTTIMPLHYPTIQMEETSASGLGGGTEAPLRVSPDADLGGLPFGHQAPAALRDGHIPIRPLQDRELNPKCCGWQGRPACYRTLPNNCSFELFIHCILCKKGTVFGHGILLPRFR